MDLNIRTYHLSFEFVGYHVWATHVDQMGASSFVTKYVYEEVVAFVK
jgi:hypothetical protein